MQYETFIDIIVNYKDKRVKPFSPKYDATVFDKVKKKALAGEEVEDGFEELYTSFVEVSTLMKRIYDDVYAAEQQIIEQTGTQAFEIISHLVAIVNCNYCAVLQNLNKELAKLKGETHSYDVVVSAKLESIDKKVGLLPIDSILEMEVDVLSMLINYVRYFRDVKFDKQPDNGIRYVESIKALFFNMSGLYALKSDYDDTILNGGFIRYDKGQDLVTFDYFNHENLKLQKVGSTVLNQKAMHEYNKNLKKDLFAIYFTGKRIKKMTIEGGSIKLKLSCGVNNYLNEKSKAFAGSITAYYDYLKNVQLPNFDNATVMEAISVWLILQALADFIQINFKWNFDVMEKDDFNKVPCRISKSMLLDYVSAMSTLPIAKQKKILSSFVSSPDRFCDMWNQPLYDCGAYYTFPLFAISQGMNFNTIDVIIESGGINLQDRGYEFERYIASEISKSHPSGYKRDVYGSRKYERNDGDYQEIDCIVELKDVVIVAELKCTQYPMNTLKQHDCWKRLRQGCKQAVAKAQFVKDNPKVFQKLSATIPGKKIIPVVVTNYPNYTGFSHEGVYVTDAHAFTSYLNTGVVTANMMSKEKGNQIVGITYLYRNEEEFSSKFADYLKENPLMKVIGKNIEIKEMVHPDIYGINTKVVYASAEVEGAPVIRNEV